MNNRRMRLLLYQLTILFQASVTSSFGWTTTTSASSRQQTHRTTIQSPRLKAVKIEGYDEAFRIIDECATTGESNDELFSAVRFLERNAFKIYPDVSHKQELWDKAHGSWKLQLSTGGAKNRSFHPPPAFLPFSFAMIAEEHFGNGIGLNENTIWLALLHKHYFNVNIRQMVVTVVGVYLGGSKATRWVPKFLGEAMNLGKTPEDYFEEKKRPPAFVIIGASEKALIARGNQSGGLAIWTRLPSDIREVAYKESYYKEYRL